MDIDGIIQKIEKLRLKHKTLLDKEVELDLDILYIRHLLYNFKDIVKVAVYGNLVDKVFKKEKKENEK